MGLRLVFGGGDWGFGIGFSGWGFRGFELMVEGVKFRGYASLESEFGAEGLGFPGWDFGGWGFELHVWNAEAVHGCTGVPRS